MSRFRKSGPAQCSVLSGQPVYLYNTNTKQLIVQRGSAFFGAAVFLISEK